MNNNMKKAMITVELGISLVLIVVVVIVTLGLFGDNLKELIASGNFSRTWQNNDAKTFYESFAGRDYSNSQMNVQIMGEQGLQNLRQKANNQLIKLIPDLEAAGSKNLADNAAYLGLIIEGIVGSPDACAYMNKPSDKICEEIPLEVKHKVKIIPPKTINIDGKDYALSSAISADVGGNNAKDKLDSIKKATKDLKDKVGKENDSNRDMKNFLTGIDKDIADLYKKHKNEKIKATLEAIATYNDKMNSLKRDKLSSALYKRTFSGAQNQYNAMTKSITDFKLNLLQTKVDLASKVAAEDLEKATALINSINTNLNNAQKALDSGISEGHMKWPFKKYFKERGDEWFGAASMLLYNNMILNDLDQSTDNSSSKNAAKNLKELGYNIGRKDRYNNNVEAQLKQLETLLKSQTDYSKSNKRTD